MYKGERIETDIKGVIVKNLKEILSEKGICGIRRRLITEQDCASLAISYLEISDAKKHYHEKTTEFYYVLSGKGELELNEDVIPLTEGTIIMIEPGVVHRAISHDNLKVLIIMSPPIGESEDQICV